jgi:hypothetical protein
MTDKYIVEPVIVDGEERYEVQRWTGSKYVTMYQNGKPLTFKLERMAEHHLSTLLQINVI